MIHILTTGGTIAGLDSDQKQSTREISLDTTPDIYANFITIQDLYSEEGEVNFEISEEQSNDQTAWVKFTTTFTDEPETFKLVKQDGQWKVTERSEGERPPF